MNMLGGLWAALFLRKDPCFPFFKFSSKNADKLRRMCYTDFIWKEEAQL
jgi:hypothetical protein